MGEVIVPCWITRYEAERLDPDDWGGPDGLARADWLHALCVRPEHHDGEHEFVSEYRITLMFPAVPA